MDEGLRTRVKRAVKRALASASGLPLVYPTAKRLADLHNGEQESDMGVNGELPFMRAQLRDARVAVDVGANVGDWAAEALAARPGLTLHCFEPCGATFELLRARALSGDVHLHRMALGEAPGTAVLRVTGVGAPGGVNSLFDRTVAGASVQVVGEETVTVDSFDRFRAQAALEHVDFVKIDTEGFELSVLRGMRASLCEGRVRTVQFEYGGTFIAARVFLLDIWNFVESLDVRYRIFKLFPDGPREVPRYREALDNFQYANYALIRDA